MRVLVTGAAGFVGYVVAALLVEQGHQVTGLTRSPESALPTGVQRLQGDLQTPETLPMALAEVDGVCHLAILAAARPLGTISVPAASRLPCGSHGDEGTSPTAAARRGNRQRRAANHHR